MNFVESAKKIFEDYKGFAKLDIVKKAGMLKLIACWIIIVEALNNYYFDIWRYINLPCLPVIAEETVWFNLDGLVSVVIAKLILDTLVHVILSKCDDDKRGMNISYIYHLIILCWSLYLLVYAVNMVLKHVNNVAFNLDIELTGAVIYLIGIYLPISYNKYRETYDYNRRIFTGFVDGNGTPIMEGDRISFFQKVYKVIWSDGEFYLQPLKKQLDFKSFKKLSDISNDCKSKVLADKNKYGEME